MDKVNFDCNNVIVFDYPPGAGGNFVANSLALSDWVVFQHSTFAEMQMDGKFELKYKVHYIHSRIEIQKSYYSTWNDLGMGMPELYGKSILKVDHCKLDEIEDIKKLNFHPVIVRLSNQNQVYFTFRIHDHENPEKAYKLWKNSKSIRFNNSRLFRVIRSYKGKNDDKFQRIWGKVSDVGKFPTSIKQISDLPQDQRNKLFSIFNDKEKNKKTNYSYEWDVNWYFSLEKTLENIKKLYNLFSLPDYNEEEIIKYYYAWIDKLDDK